MNAPPRRLQTGSAMIVAPRPKAVEAGAEMLRDGFGYVLRGHVNELGHAAVTPPGIVRTTAEAYRSWASPG
jgi:gamma-glutamyltranspeptidase